MNYNLVIDTSNFKPCDISVPLAIIDDYNKGYDKNKEVYDKISETLGNLDTAVQGTEKAKGIYDNYNEAFNIAADAFAKGMTTKNSRQLSTLRSRYFREINKLEKAREAMKAIADTRAKLAATGKANDMLYQDIGNLDNYLDNPNYSPKAYDGNQITANVAAIMDKIKQGLASISKGKALDPYTDVYSILDGVDAAQANQIMQQLSTGQPITSIPIVGDAVNRILNNAGYNDWMDDNTKERALNYALTGVYGLLGKKDIKTKDNREAIAALQDKYKAKDEARQYAFDLAKMKKQAELSAAAASAKAQADSSSEVLIPQDIISQGEYNDNLSKLDDNWQKYFTQRYAQGTQLLTQNYWDALTMDDKAFNKKYPMSTRDKSQSPNSSAIHESQESTQLRHYRHEARTWLDTIAPDWRKHAQGPGQLRNYVAQQIQQYKAGNVPKAGVDTELVYPITDSDQANAKLTISRSATGAMPVKWDSKTRTYKDDAKEAVPSGDLFPEGSTIAGVALSDKGIVFRVNTPKDGQVTYRLPKDINSTEIDAMQRLMQKRKMVLDMGEKVDAQGNIKLNASQIAFIKKVCPSFTGTTITKNFLDALNKQITQVLGKHMTNIFITNSPQKQKVSYTDY